MNVSMRILKTPADIFSESKTELVFLDETQTVIFRHVLKVKDVRALKEFLEQKNR